MRTVLSSGFIVAGLAGMLATAGCSQHHTAAPVALEPQHALSMGEFQGQATLLTDQTSVLIGQYLLLKVRFHNAGPAREFYNPLFDPDMPAPAVLAIYDAKQRYLGNLLPAQQMMGPTPEAWLLVSSGGTVEGAISVPTAYFPGKPDLQLKPATYTIQLIYSKAFVSPRPAGEVDGSALAQELSELGVMRSNAVQIHLSSLTLPK